MKRYLNLITRLYDKKIDASGLAILRVTYGLVLLGEIIQLYCFRHLVYDKIPYLEPAVINYALPLIVWMIAVVFVILGWYTRMAAIVSYLCTLFFIATVKSYEYHMFYVYTAVNFLFIFMPVSRVGSLDRLREIWRYSNTRRSHIPSTKVSVLNYHIIVFAAIALVYFDSVFYKTASPMWMGGLGMWLPASLPQAVNSDMSYILNIRWLVVGLGYLTLVFEALFLFVFFRKRWRVPMLIIGIGLHLGILIAYPIPWFGLGYIALYLVMVPVSFWRKVLSLIRFRSPSVTIFYDEECPLCSRVKYALEHLDFFHAIRLQGLQSGGFDEPKLAHIGKDELLDNIYALTSNGKVLKGIDTYIYAFTRMPLLWPAGLIMRIPGVYHLSGYLYRKIASTRNTERCTEENCGYAPPMLPQDSDRIKIARGLTLRELRIKMIAIALVFACLLQLNCTYNAKLVKEFKARTGISSLAVEKRFMKNVSEPMRDFSRIFFGIYVHPVFMDSHFDRFNHIVAVEYVPSDGSAPQWLPMIDQQGTPGSYVSGLSWPEWTFRITRTTIKNDKLERGLRDMTAFWLGQHNISLEDAHFRVMVKAIESPEGWEHNFLRKQMQQPWVEAGTFIWKDGKYTCTLADIEAIPIPQ